MAGPDLVLGSSLLHKPALTYICTYYVLGKCIMHSEQLISNGKQTISATLVLVLIHHFLSSYPMNIH